MNKWLVIHIKKGENKMGNEIVKTEKRELTGTVKLQVELANELNVASEQMGASFTDYGKKCVVNAIAGLAVTCTNQGISLKDLDPTLLKINLQNVGYTELNYAAIPSEIYFDLRKTTKYDDDGNKITKYNITIKPQGAGNEKLTRKYGVGLKKDIGLHSPWLVREGDEFELPSFNGIDMTPPKWKPKSLDGKVTMVVYPAVKVDGSVEYLMATREGIKANIIAQIRQNSLYAFTKEEVNSKGRKYEKVDTEARDKFYEELNAYAESHKVEELLAEPKFAEYVNPTYTSGGSKEQMILRKMKNNALKNYPKEYDNAYIRDAVEGMFEDVDDSLKEKPIKKDVVAKVEKEINETPQSDAVQDFNVDENGEIKDVESTLKEEVKETEPKVEETKEEAKPQPEEKPKAEEKVKQTKSDDDGDEDYGF